MRVRDIWLGLAGGVLCSGCADLMARNPAPEWFETARREMKGEDYPELNEVPQTRVWILDEASANVVIDRLDATGGALDAAAANAPVRTPEDIRATAAQLRASTERNGSRQGGTP